MEPGTEIVQMFSNMAVGTRQEIRDTILNLQAHLEQSDEKLPVTVCPVKHFFAPGMYGREITMPTDMFVIGRIHRHGHLNVISKGRCRVLTEFGSEELVAPCTFVSEPGTKRMVYVLEETVWTTVHITEETDVDKIVAAVTAESYDDIEIAGDYYEVLL